LGDLIWRHIARVAQQEPSRPLHILTTSLIITQAICLINSYAVNHFAAVFGDNVKQVVDHLGPSAVPLYLQVLTVNLMDGAPVKTGEFANMSDWQFFAPMRYKLRQAARHSGMAI